MAWLLQGGEVLRDGALGRGDLALDGGMVAATAPAAARRLDAAGLLVLPGDAPVGRDIRARCSRLRRIPTPTSCAWRKWMPAPARH